MWASTLSSEAYLGLTIHYVDENWTLQRFLLNIIPFKTRHTGINMATVINNVLCEFNLVSKALALTTDNESAMLTALRMLAIKHENIRELMPSSIAWTKIKEMIIVLEPLERTTKNLSSSKYPTIANIRFYFNEIQDHLKYCEPTTKVINTLKEKYSLYYSKVPQLRTFIPNENNNTLGREYFYQLKKRHLEKATEAARAKILPSNNPNFVEIERYLALPCDENVEVLLW
ncbi:zinc finger BED domain-containing protein 1-like [Rhizophagus clarus]|uniref:Zinc finger BED domain-containing protein 1-like n=1 Tax=Rhizophagus clarus TaxID=94130 RepID=A0A8H3QX52_9GLOM|nr:zinc finger BED domain-containing protein 1-like [Rhizophagus clarus]